MIRLICSTRELSRLIHAKRVRIDPSFRGELIRLFDNPKARMAYFSKHGLSIDDLGEAIFDAGLCFERPTCDDVLETLESLFTPGVVRQSAGKRESAGILADVVDGFERELEVRRKNRWRSFKCACFNSAKIRATKDELPVAFRPTLHVRLFAQTPMGGQADLFDFGLSGTPACSHRFDPCAQLTFEGDTTRICTLCGEASNA